YVVDRPREPRIIDRLEHVVDGLCGECTERVVFMCGDEDRRRHGIRTDFANDGEPVDDRHLYVEENEVRLPRSDCDDRVSPAAPLIDDVEAAESDEARADSLPREWFVVDDDRPPRS